VRVRKSAIAENQPIAILPGKQKTCFHNQSLLNGEKNRLIATFQLLVLEAHKTCTWSLDQSAVKQTPGKKFKPNLKIHYAELGDIGASIGLVDFVPKPFSQRYKLLSEF